MELKKYEIILLLRPGLSDKQKQDKIESVTSDLKSSDCGIVKVFDCGLKPLEYKIKKHAQAYFVQIDYTAKSCDIIKVQEKLKYDQEVIRYLNVVVKHHNAETAFTDSVAEIESEKIMGPDFSDAFGTF